MTSPPRANGLRTSRDVARGAIRSATSSKVVRQSASYAASAVAINAMALVTTVILTRILSVEKYSEYAFSLNLLIFMSIFFELGMFYPAAQLIAKAEPQPARALTGAAVFLWLAASGLFTAVVLASTFGPLQTLFKLDVAVELRTIAPLAGAWLATQLALLVAQGHGRLHVYSSTNVTSSALLLICAMGALALGSHDDVILMLLLYGITSLIGSVICLAWFKPTFRSTRATRAILTQTRAWGLSLFTGRVLSMGTYRLDVLMLGALTTGGGPVATYVLATAIAAPVGLPGMASATALFQRMTTATRINLQWMLLPLALALVGTLLLALFGSALVGLLFSDSYAAVSALLVPLSIAAALQGTTTLFNKFLTAHGRGKELRTAALWLTVANVVFNFALIPPFAASGAAWASVLALTVNLAAHMRAYISVIQRLTIGPSNRDASPDSLLCGDD